MPTLNLSHIHTSWLPYVNNALKTVDPDYLHALAQRTGWLPGHDALFNAFSLPLPNTHYILFGESPYPRAASANGYAFWDNVVESLWSSTGLSKTVNRAVSLRHLMKMLLVAEGVLDPRDTSQPAIMVIDKKNYVQTGRALFENFLDRGILLLNACLVLSDLPVTKEARAWRPFMASLLSQLSEKQNDIQLILFGQIAKIIETLPGAASFSRLNAEHPYNHSFVTNSTVIDFFRPLHLLSIDRLQNNSRQRYHST